MNRDKDQGDSLSRSMRAMDDDGQKLATLRKTHSPDVLWVMMTICIRGHIRNKVQGHSRSRIESTPCIRMTSIAQDYYFSRSHGESIHLILKTTLESRAFLDVEPMFLCDYSRRNDNDFGRCLRKPCQHDDGCHSVCECSSGNSVCVVHCAINARA